MGINLAQTRILIVTSERQKQTLLTSLLSQEGCLIKNCFSIYEALNILSGEPFDLIISDFASTQINGLELSKSLRSNFRFRNICLIFMATSGNSASVIDGFSQGADDYLEEPLESQEVLTRIKISLMRKTRDLETNPLTKLPGNSSLIRELDTRVKSKEPLAAAYLDLNKLKEFNNCYGFEKGDEVIRLTAKIIMETLENMGNRTDFLSHTGGDDFIFLTSYDCIQDMCNGIIEKFDREILSFYSDGDKKRGHLVIKNRSGQLENIPFLSISLGIATNENRSFSHIAEIIQIITECKNYAKTLKGSNYVKDRRKT